MRAQQGEQQPRLGSADRDRLPSRRASMAPRTHGCFEAAVHGTQSCRRACRTLAAAAGGRQEPCIRPASRLRALGPSGRPFEKEHQRAAVEVKVIKGVFDQEQKQEMITKITETMVEIEGEALRGVTWVSSRRVESGDWGIGGQGSPPRT